MENKGNPWNMSPTARMDWAKDLPFEVKVVGEDVEDLDEVEWLFWVGCAGAYEDRAKKTTRAVAELLDMAGVSFAVLGNGETCTGDSARRAGNEFVFQGLATQNIETFKEYKVKKVVTTCAHCFNTLKNEYRQLGIELEVVHHTQLLNRLVREKKLTPIRTDPALLEGQPAPQADHLPRPVLPRPAQPGLRGAARAAQRDPRQHVRRDAAQLGAVLLLRRRRRAHVDGGDHRLADQRDPHQGGRGDRRRADRRRLPVLPGDALRRPHLRAEQRRGTRGGRGPRRRADAARRGQGRDQAGREEGRSRRAEAKAGAGAAAGGTATATIEREETKAEPEAGDTTQTDETVTDTEDVGAAAKASGGGSLFDVGDDSERRRPSELSGQGDARERGRPRPVGPRRGAPELGEARGRSRRTSLATRASVAGRCSTSAATTPPRRRACGRAEGRGDRRRGGPQRGRHRRRRHPEGETEAVTETERTEEPEAEDAPASPAPPPPRAPRSPRAARCSTSPHPRRPHPPRAEPRQTTRTTRRGPGRRLHTDADVDRSQDDADTDVAPDEPRPSESQGRGSGIRSGTAATPGTEIPEGGSLFDIEAPAEETVTRSRRTPTEDRHDGEDPAGDSTTDADVDRSQDDADDRRRARRGRGRGRAEEPKAEAAPASSGTAATPGTEIPEGGSLFDIEAPAEEPRQASPPSPRRGHRRAPEPSAGGRRRPQPGRRRHRRRTRARAGALRHGGRADETASDDAPVTSLRDIKAKHSGESLTDDAEPAPRKRRRRAEAAGGRGRRRDRRAPRRTSDRTDEDEPEEKPKPASSGETHQPRTDAEIGEGGSLFDL